MQFLPYIYSGQHFTTNGRNVENVDIGKSLRSYEILVLDFDPIISAIIENDVLYARLRLRTFSITSSCQDDMLNARQRRWM